MYSGRKKRRQRGTKQAGSKATGQQGIEAKWRSK
jgi:hypothetical protein